MMTIAESARELDVIGNYDVVVVGGGPGGLPAAVAAARHGAKTLLIERYGFLGGLATSGLVGPIIGHKAPQSETPVLGGIPKEICVRLAELGGAAPWEAALKAWAIPFDVECLKLVADQLVRGSGVAPLLHCLATGVITNEDTIRAVVIETKSGRQAVTGKVFVDATGDADLTYWAGGAYEKGRPMDGLMQPMGTIFRVGGVGQVQFSDDVREKMRAAIDAGELVMFRPTVGGKGSTIRKDEVTFNATRFAGDATNVRDLTQAEIGLRRQTWDIVQYCRRHVPGMEHAYLVATPTQVGVREGRRIIGPAVLTADHVLNAVKSNEGIARAATVIDIHCPLGRVKGGVWSCNARCPGDPPCVLHQPEHRHNLHDRLGPPPGEWFDIPYGCLRPLGVRNLLAAGRLISADHFAHGSVRVLGPCLAVGEAAGTAAALAADQGVDVADVNVTALRTALEGAGALV